MRTCLCYSEWHFILMTLTISCVPCYKLFTIHHSSQAASKAFLLYLISEWHIQVQFSELLFLSGHHMSNNQPGWCKWFLVVD